MANSYTKVTLSGAQQNGFTTPSYMESAHLTVTVNGVAVPSTSVGASQTVFGSFTSSNPLFYTIVEGQTSLNFSESIPSGAIVIISRSTNQNTRLVDFIDGAVLTSEALDKDGQQSFFMAQEALEKVFDSATTNVNIKNQGVHGIVQETGGGQLYLQGTSAVNLASYSATGLGTNYAQFNSSGADITGNITVSGTVDGRDVATDGAKLDGIEASATADQTASEIRTLVESASDSNVFTDADHTKLNGIAAGAEVNVTNNPTFTGTLTMGDNDKITLGTGGDLEIYHDGSNSHILDKGTGSLSIDSAHFAIRTSDTDSSDTTPTEHLRMTAIAGASGSTAFSAGNESSGSLSTGMTNPRLTLTPKIGSNAGQIQVRGKLAVSDDPIDSSATGSALISTTGDLTVSGASTLSSGLHIGGDITRSGNTAFPFNHGATFTRTSGDNTALQVLNTGTPSSSFTCYASIEVGGNGGSFIDVKKPNTDDYDLRIEHGVASDNVSFVSSKHPLVLQTQPTSAGGTGGEVTIKREGSAKLATSATGIDVTGTVTADAITSTPTTEVVSTNTVPTVAVNKKYINTYSSGVNAYTLPTGTAGQMITFVNASSQNITLARNTNSITLSKVIAGSDPANVTDATITVGKSGTVEVVYTGTNTAVIFGSGLS